MNYRSIFHLISYTLLLMGLALAFCWGFARAGDDPASAIHAFAWSSLLVLAAGGSMLAITRGHIDLTRRDGIGVVAFGWLAITLSGALPYLLAGSVPHLLDGWFESVSGFTTTGASIIAVPEDLPGSLLLWRAMTNFFGGMGILVLCIAILPLLDSGGMQLYRAEASGVLGEKMTPRIQSTAKALYGIYIGLNAACAILLKLGGMNWLDAICHAFAALATGGFSTKTASVAHFESQYVESVLVVFMLLGAMNFLLHFQALRGGGLRTYFQNSEFRFFLGFWALACLFLTLNTHGSVYASLGHAARAALFDGTSILTTTGFATDDFDTWPAASKMVLLLCMLIGGCAGSTSGGMKHIRLTVVLKRIVQEIRLFVYPNAVIQIKLQNKSVPADVISRIAVFCSLYLVTFLVASIGLCLFTDMETAFSSVAATLGGVGPGFGQAGAIETYTDFAPAAKGILIFCMLLGRLEFYTLLVILSPHFWKK